MNAPDRFTSHDVLPVDVLVQLIVGRACHGVAKAIERAEKRGRDVNFKRLVVRESRRTFMELCTSLDTNHVDMLISHFEHFGRSLDERLWEGVEAEAFRQVFKTMKHVYALDGLGKTILPKDKQKELVKHLHAAARLYDNHINHARKLAKLRVLLTLYVADALNRDETSEPGSEPSNN